MKSILKYTVAAVALLFAVTVHAQTADSLTATDTASLPAVGHEAAAPIAADSALSSQQLWEAASSAYVAGSYATAIRDYEAILSRGEYSVKLYYNLGGAYFKSGRLGKAILFYNRAARLAPSSDDVRYNLQFAENYTKDKIEAVPEFFLRTWLRTLRSHLDCTAWAIVSLLMLAATLGLALLYLLSNNIVRRKVGFFGMLASVLLLALTASFAAAQYRQLTSHNEAIVMPQSAAVKSSPDRSAKDLFVLHEGTKVRITSRVDRWREVTIADGKKGWLEEEVIEEI